MNDRKIKAAIAGVMYYMGSAEAPHRVEPLVQTVMPSPIWAGVLGMERTTLACTRPLTTVSMRAPATMAMS